MLYEGFCAGKIYMEKKKPWSLIPLSCLPVLPASLGLCFGQANWCASVQMRGRRHTPTVTPSMSLLYWLVPASW